MEIQENGERELKKGSIQRTERARQLHPDPQCAAKTRPEIQPTRTQQSLGVDRENFEGRGFDGAGDCTGGMCGQLIAAARLRLANIDGQIANLRIQRIQEEQQLEYLLLVESQLKGLPAPEENDHNLKP